MWKSMAFLSSALSLLHPHSYSRRDPLKVSLVSCRVAISILSHLSSRSMIAVFLESSICWKSFDKPGHMVLTFQLARAGIFFILFDLPGVTLSIHLLS